MVNAGLALFLRDLKSRSPLFFQELPQIGCLARPSQPPGIFGDMGLGGRELRIDEQQIRHRVGELARQISGDYRGKDPLFVCVLRGVAPFCADLVRLLDFRLKVDFIAVASYGSATASSGQVQLIKDLDHSIRGVHVVLVEDIVDTGLTASYLVDNLYSRGPASLRVCSLLSKPSRRKVHVTIDYLGLEIPNRFVVGYGLDWNQRYRNLPFLTSLGESSNPPGNQDAEGGIPSGGRNQS